MSNPSPILYSERLAFSTWLPEQVKDINHLHSFPEVAKHLMGEPEEMAASQRRFETWSSDFKEYGWCKFRLTKIETGEFVGRAGFGAHEGQPEIGYALLPQHWGQGFAFEAASALRDWFFEHQSHDYFLGYAHSANAASVHVLRKIGMKFTHTEHDDSGNEFSFHKLTRAQWHG